MVFVPFLLGCDELARFKQEKLECRTQKFGNFDLIIQKRKIGSNIHLIGDQFDEQLKITRAEDKIIIGISKAASADININTKKVILRVGNSVETLKCKHHNFKM